MPPIRLSRMTLQQRLVTLLREHLRGSDMVCPSGVEECIALLPGASATWTHAAAVAQRRLVIDGKPHYRITVSEGVAESLEGCGHRTVVDAPFTPDQPHWPWGPTV